MRAARPVSFDGVTMDVVSVLHDDSINLFGVLSQAENNMSEIVCDVLT